MSNKEKISIIVCVYNTEKYIEKCIDSILNQTYKNIELVIVNDCSVDNSISIIKEKQKSDKRIVLIDNKENKGLSYSRNIALEKSTGDYIGYIDSDDYIAEDYYEKLLKALKKENADISICDMKLVYEYNNTFTKIKCGGPKKTDFINCGLAASACNKLFKRKIIKQYKFSEGKVNEDLAVVLPLIINCNKVAYEENVVYNYVQRDNSIQNSKISDKRFDIFYGVDLTLERIKNVKNYKEYEDIIVFQQLISLFLYVFTNEKNFFKRIKWFKKYSKLIKKYDAPNNYYFKQLLDESGKKHKIYYSLLVKLIDLRLCILSSILVQIYNILKFFLIKKVIPDNIDLATLERLAKKQKKQKENIKISVIIPNYNYESFLLQRLYSILNQEEKIYEIIILDDFSTDNSRKLIEKICNKLNKYLNIKYVFNKNNSGSAFKQWEKGFNEANGEYVWICEADDYCDKHFLKNVTKPIKANKNIIISYSDTAFIDKDGNIIIKTIVPEIDIMKTGHWNENYINNGINEVKDYSFLNCTIANVSSAIIKKDNYKKEFELSGHYKQAGDWLFYTNIMRKGEIAYINKSLNYYRLHGNNVSSVTKKEAHIKEIKSIYKYELENYELNKDATKKMDERIKFLEKVWEL